MSEMLVHNDELDQLETTIQSQLTIIKEMRQIKREVADSEQRMLNLVEKVSKEITINYEEQKQIQSIVSLKANQLAEQHLLSLDAPYSDNLFKAWKGLFIRRIYAKLKTRMNVVRYTAVKREDFDNLITYLDELNFSHFKLRELQPTLSILQIMELEQS